MCTHLQAVQSNPPEHTAVTHGTRTGSHWKEAWIDLLLADEDWVRREFDELINHGWGGDGRRQPPTTQGTHHPRRPWTRHRPTHQLGSPIWTSAGPTWRVPTRGPPVRI